MSQSVQTDTMFSWIHMGWREWTLADVWVSFQYQSPAVICHSILNHRGVMNASCVPVCFFGLSSSSASVSRASAPPSFTIHSVTPPQLASCLKQTNEWVTPGRQMRGYSSHYLFVPFTFTFLSTVLSGVRYLTAYAHSAEFTLLRVQQKSAMSLCLINMLMVRGRVCVHTHWINGNALLWFRPGSQKEASVQGCFRTHKTTEHFNHHTARGQEWMCVCKWILLRGGKERDIQHPAAKKKGGVKMVTFCLYRMSIQLLHPAETLSTLTTQRRQE